MPNYKVHSRVLLDGTFYETGDVIALSEEAAKLLGRAVGNYVAVTPCLFEDVSYQPGSLINLPESAANFRGLAAQIQEGPRGGTTYSPGAPHPVG